MLNKKNKISTSRFLEIFNDPKEKKDNEEINISINALRKNMVNSPDGDICLSLDDLSCFENTIYGYINIIKCNDIDMGIKQATKQIRELLDNQVQMNRNITNPSESILIHFNLPPSYDMMEVSAVMDQVHEHASEEASVCLCISYDKLKEKNDIEIHSFLFF